MFQCVFSFSQGRPPWESPLLISWSQNGTTFTNTSTFQDSSGVPSVIRWKGDTLVCVFQWFRQPINSASWDRVAVKYSYDAGQTWTNPVPIMVSGLPSGYQRPFDPTLAVINKDTLRIYFSSSKTMPIGGLDSIVNTYSALSTNGVNYIFESGARFDHPTKPVIDPAVMYFKNIWHYCAPAGAPQQGAFHCVSTNGIIFGQQANYPSDNFHNWTGNFMVENPNLLRFYGSGSAIWYNSSADGAVWQGYVNTNLIGGDPSVVKISNTSYLAIYVGQPYATGTEIRTHYIERKESVVFPNPFNSTLSAIESTELNKFELMNSQGALIWKGEEISSQDFSSLPAGMYTLKMIVRDSSVTKKVVKE